MHANCESYLISQIQQKVTNEINSPFCRAAEQQPSFGYPDRGSKPSTVCCFHFQSMTQLIITFPSSSHCQRRKT